MLDCGSVFFFQAEDGIRDLVRSRGLGDVYKRQVVNFENLSVNANGYTWDFGDETVQSHAESPIHTLSLIHI